MPSNRRTLRLMLLLVVCIALFVAAILLPPQAQPTDYHHFADTRAMWSIANVANVATNLPFLWLGCAGLAFLWRDRRSGAAFAEAWEGRAYAVFFAGVTLTGIGSSYYHLSPDNARLVWDRLPMTLAFMSLLAATITERLSPLWGRRLLGPLVLLGLGTVLYWRWGLETGAENVVPYLVLQYGAVTLLVLISALFPARYTHASYVYLTIGLYVLAKVAESGDARVLSASSFISGHSLKHLLAALAVVPILRMLELRARSGRDTRKTAVEIGPEGLCRNG